MEFYHVINRGVEKRKVFLDDGDRIRFIHNMYVFNDTNIAPNYIVKERTIDRQRKILVRIHSFCLMPNHYHLLLSPARENGISLFMQKLNMGYSKYFNEKYERTGVLWQGTFKKILISRNAHFIYIPYYIHLNPLDLAYPEWRRGAVKKYREAINYLENYRWSSHLDYIGKHNFPSVIQMTELKNILGHYTQYKKELVSVISDPSLSQNSSFIEL